MKRIFFLAFAAASLAACSNTSNDTAGTNDTSTTVTTSTTNNAAYSPTEGDITRRDGKVMIMRNGQWVEADNDVRMDNGATVNRDGRVLRDGRERELGEGETVNSSGEFFDRTGRAIENAWEDTKQGVKKAGDKIEDAVDNDNRR